MSYEEIELDKIKGKVLRYILYKTRTRQEVKRKFENEIEEDILEEILDYYEELGYLGDNEYIR